MNKSILIVLLILSILVISGCEMIDSTNNSPSEPQLSSINSLVLCTGAINCVGGYGSVVIPCTSVVSPNRECTEPQCPVGMRKRLEHGGSCFKIGDNRPLQER